MPGRSNLQIAKTAKVDDKTVAKIRTEMEARSEIPNVAFTRDEHGRAHPVRKPKRSAAKAKPDPAVIVAAPNASPPMAPASDAPPEGVPAFLLRDDQKRAQAEEAEFNRIVGLYQNLALNTRARFWAHVIGKDAIELAEAAIAKLSPQVRFALADRIIRPAERAEGAA
jgi:hypothetical protein